MQVRGKIWQNWVRLLFLRGLKLKSKLVRNGESSRGKSVFIDVRPTYFKVNDSIDLKESPLVIVVVKVDSGSNYYIFDF